MPSPLEVQLVFPGSASQGQPDAQVRPPTGCELVTLHAPDQTKIVALFGKPTQSHLATPRPTLLFFYGNGEDIAASLDLFNHLRRLGFNIIIPDYEGYGLSDGSPSEPGCYAAADAAYDYLLTRPDVDQTRIIAAGWSLGAAVAVDLAARRPVAGLATFSAFTNIPDMMRAFLQGASSSIQFVSKFDNLAKIPTVPCPIFMAHGSQDQLVPSDMLNILAQAAKSKVTTLKIPTANHNDLFQQGGDPLYQRLKSFVDGLSPVSSTTRPQ